MNVKEFYRLKNRGMGLRLHGGMGHENSTMSQSCTALFSKGGPGGIHFKPLFHMLLCCLMLILIPAVSALAGDSEKSEPKKEIKTAQKATDKDAKELSGMSIVGNDEAPKSLYIVPWKSSEIGVETTLNTSLNEGDAPVDRDVFVRQLEFYRVSRGKQ